jgi:hypothetical protein
VGVAVGEPLGFAGLAMAGHRAHAFDVARKFQIGDRDQQMRAVVVVTREHSTGLQFDLRNAHSVVDEQDVLRAAGEDL